jgi:hypothetical protein
MKIKKCNRCNVEKEVNYFANNKRSIDGLNPTCRSCKKEMSLIKVKFNQENRIIPKNGLKCCNKCKLEQVLENFCKNNNTIDGYNRICKSCKSLNNVKFSDKNKKYYFSNKDKYNNVYYPKQNLIKREKYNNDPIYKVSVLLRNRLSKILKRNKIYKTNSTIELLGCSFEFFKEYIEKQFKLGMDWSNNGSVWELDHIKPISLFDLSLEKELRECFNYKNLQPLFKTTEISKSFGYINEIGNRNKSNIYEIL